MESIKSSFVLFKVGLVAGHQLLKHLDSFIFELQSGCQLVLQFSHHSGLLLKLVLHTRFVVQPDFLRLVVKLQLFI